MKIIVKYTMAAFVLMMSLTLVSSCSKKLPVKTVKFSDTDSLTFFQNGYQGYKSVEKNANIVIVRIKLWRKKHNCLHGLGICSIKFFPKEKSSLNGESKGRTIDVPLLTGNDGRQYIKLYFAQNVSQFTLDELKLTIDQNLAVNNLNVIAGVYQYRKAIGPYGGYLIPLKK